MTKAKKIINSSFTALIGLVLLGGTAHADSITLTNRLTGPDSRNINRVDISQSSSHHLKTTLHHRHHDRDRWNLDFDRLFDFDRFELGSFRNSVDIDQRVTVDADTGHNVQSHNTIAGDIRTGDISVHTDIDNR